MSEAKFYVPKRYIVTVLGFFGMFSLYTMEVNLTVAMVAMINATKPSNFNRSAIKVGCVNLITPEEKSSKVEFKGEQYNWDSEQEGLILGAFFYGYAVTQLPGGLLCAKYGAKWLFGGSVLLSSMLTVLTPLAARGGVAALVVLRIFIGLTQGISFPAVNHIASRWSPVMERTRISTIIYTGTQIGSVVSLMVSGWLSSTEVLGGWPSAFYVFGFVGCVWFTLWAFFMYESPSDHPTISKAELAYIEKSKESSEDTNPSVPWKDVLSSKVMWAAIVAHIGDTLGFTVFLTELPNYLSSVLHYDLKDDGALSSLPIIMQALAAGIAAVIADKLRMAGIFNITSIRKILNTIGFVGPAICLLAVTAIGCQPQPIIGMLTLAMTLNGFVYAGIYVVYLDMCPEFAGTLFGLANSVSNFCGILAPSLVGIFTSRGGTQHNWNKVFYITAATYIGCAIIFLFFVSAEEQPWGLKAKRKNSDQELNQLPATKLDKPETNELDNPVTSEV